MRKTSSAIPEGFSSPAATDELIKPSMDSRPNARSARARRLSVTPSNASAPPGLQPQSPPLAPAASPSTRNRRLSVVSTVRSTCRFASDAFTCGPRPGVVQRLQCAMLRVSCLSFFCCKVATKHDLTADDVPSRTTRLPSDPIPPMRPCLLKRRHQRTASPSRRCATACVHQQQRESAAANKQLLVDGSDAGISRHQSAVKPACALTV